MRKTAKKTEALASQYFKHDNSKLDKLMLKTVAHVEITSAEGEQRSFLDTRGISKAALFEDIANGATPFVPIAKGLNDNDLGRRVTIIKARSLENGLKAVAYLAPIHALADGYSEDEDDWGDGDTDAESLLGELCDSETRYPIVEANRVLSDSGRAAMDAIPLGPMSMATGIQPNQNLPFYRNQEHGPIVISHTPGYTMFNIDLSPIIQSFSGNRRIYVIWLKTWEIVHEDDKENVICEEPEIISLMLKHNASVYYLRDEKEQNIKYLCKVAEDLAEDLNMTFNKNFDKRRLIEITYDCANDGFRADLLEKLFKRLNETSSVIGDNAFRMLGQSERAVTKPKTGKSVLDTMVGMESVKAQLERYLNTLAYAKERKRSGVGTNIPTTILMVGDAGTGKTECARALAGMAFERDLIPTSSLVTITGTELNAEYLGQTRVRVQEIFSSARGGVLFIDEAYSLSDGTSGDTDLYSRQAIAQMLVELDRIAISGDTIVIFAGYENRMNKFLETNPGLKSRSISCVIRFPSYNEYESADIYFGICRREGFITDMIEADASIREKLADYFRRIKNVSGYGNGRSARNLVLQTVSEIAERVAKNGGLPSMSGPFSGGNTDGSKQRSAKNEGNTGRTKNGKRREVEICSELNLILAEDVEKAIEVSLDMMTAGGSRQISFI